jgi:hypothetical protein
MVSLLITSFMKSVIPKFKTTSLATNHIFTRLFHKAIIFRSMHTDHMKQKSSQKRHRFCYRSYVMLGEYSDCKCAAYFRRNCLTRKLRIPKFSKYAYKSHFPRTCMFDYWNLEAMAEWRIPYSNLAISHQLTESSCAIMAGKSNMELLLRDADRIEPFLSRWWNPVAASTIGVITVFIVRYSQRRPLISGT